MMTTQSDENELLRPRWRGCRIVTTSLTARVILANQLRSLPEAEWTVLSGDRYDEIGRAHV